jgi:DNA polymerase III subunit gamma/tau
MTSARPVRKLGSRLLAWRHPGQLPQGGNAARVTGLWRVREGSLLFVWMDVAGPVAGCVLPSYAEVALVSERNHLATIRASEFGSGVGNRAFDGRQGLLPRVEDLAGARAGQAVGIRSSGRGPREVGCADYPDQVATALYRRYRPETFAELIGQSQVTDPLRTALRTDRVNHAYLFSGPRGCGKTTSARILARCLNCAEGPTDTPCGTCPSCIELSRDGGGSLDVVEIDAASHNGVDDARDLRERAVFAPARDRYKIFILDEAHMVTPQGFNALLKIVEEPPEHVKFIFATTEPEKVIGTIRSRTHHYPFRLVPPAQMLEYTQTLCDAEGITVAPGVLSLVVRAGGGSVRDTLSLLDQLMAGSEPSPSKGTVTIEYERAVALLGYTNSALLDEVVDSIGARDSAAAFTAVDRVIQTGQDPRRFVEDLLERFRDLIVVAATSAEGAAAVLRGVPQDELDRMAAQAKKFGDAELSRAADVANAALTEMTGATSPRLHLELMIARILVPESDETGRGALARVERLERRIGVDAADVAPARPVAETKSRVEPKAAAAEPGPTPPIPSDSKDRSAAPVGIEAAEVAEASAEAKTVTLAQLRDSWPEILESVKENRTAWMVVYTSQARALEGDVLTVTFPNETDVASFKKPQGPGESVSEILRGAILAILGLRVKFIAKVEPTLAAIAEEIAVSEADAPEPTEPDAEPAVNEAGWAVAAIPGSVPDPPVEASKPVSVRSAVPAAKSAPSGTAQPQRYGESVVREILGASFIEEQTVAPRVTPREN